jgi:hypothetical protein
MKKFITIWIGCSLALAVGALAQQEESQPTPNKKQHKAKSAQAAHPPAGQPGQQAPPAGPHAGKQAKGHPAAPNQPHAHTPATKPHAQAHATNPHEQAPATRPTDVGANSNDAQAEQKKNHKGQGAANNPHEQAPATGPTDTGVNSNDAQAERKMNRKGQRATNESANTAHAPEAPNANTATSEQARQRSAGKDKAKQVDVQKIKTQHANFRAQPKPQQVPAVTFNESRQISGSDHWQGTQYTVFRSYRPQWHDQNWYHSRYDRIVLIAGGYYFFNAGYWYPAWGYQPSAQYYAYDGPIYAGSQAEPPDRVIADVQAALQEMGYYQGEVDGLLGPLTREALIGYQTDNGLYTTAAIDQPTLDSLGI